MKILITGSTGNVGLSILESIAIKNDNLNILAGVRDYEADSVKLEKFNVSLVTFDFENLNTFKSALHEIEILFLLRPPQISNVSKYFKPLIDEAINSKVKHILFLSVQGVEKNIFIPHNKIEALIKESNISYTFLRPAYFMQNFTTTLNKDLIENHRIFLPAGEAKFTIIDIDDIGNVAAKILTEPGLHINKSYELTNNETLTFTQMAEKLSKGLDKTIKYISPNLIRFYFTKRKENVSPVFIFVMILLHYLPRFQQTPKQTKWVKIISGQEPKSFDEFIDDNRMNLQ